MAMLAHAPDAKFNSRQVRLGAVRGILTATNSEVLGAWAIWAILTLAGICFVAIYGLQFPYADEWDWIGRVTGAEPVTVSWLWSQHNEHRMFLPRLIYLGLGAISGFDFRAGTFFNIFLLSGLALAMMLAARAVRGKTSLYDAFFPLLLLHWAQAYNLIWGFQLNFVTAVVLQGVVLLVVLRCGNQLSLKSAAVVMICLLSLGLCGAYGLILLPTMICWLLYASACKWQGGGLHAKRDALIMSVFAAMPAALIVLYFHGFQSGVARQGIYVSLSSCIQFLSSGIGPAAEEIWPVSGFLILAVCAIIVWECLSVFRNQPAQRLRAAGFLMFLAGMIVLGLAIGFGRSFIGPRAGFEVRYMTLAAPLLLLVYFHCEVYGNAALRRHVPRTLFILMCILCTLYAGKGIGFSRNLWGYEAKFAQDMREGISPDALGLRYAEQQGPWPREVFSTRLAWLQKARLGPYGSSTQKSWESVRVEDICRQGAAKQIIDQIRLLPGQSFAQRFSVKEDGELRRIDVRIDIGREGRSLKRLDWALYRITPDEKENLLARDFIDPSKSSGDYYFSIPLKHVSARKTEQFVLVLGMPADAPQMTSVTIPLYQIAENKEMEQGSGNAENRSKYKSAGVLRGFLFLESGNLSDPLVARRIGDR